MSDAKFLIRRALLIPFQQRMTLDGYSWHQVGEDLVAGRRGTKDYFRTHITYGEDLPLEVGEEPLTQVDGSIIVGVFSDPTLGVDGNDLLCKVVREIYPYNSDLPFGGIRVHTNTVDDGDLVRDGSYLYSPVTVNWTVYKEQP